MLVLASAPAAAQDTFLKPNPSTRQAAPAPAPEQQIDEMLGQQTPQVPTLKTSADYANAYYNNCVRQQHPVMKGEDLELLCACTSAKFSEVMTVEQAKAMNEDTPEGQFQRNRMMMFVYAPCIEFPTRAMIMHSCLSDPKARYSMKNPQATCSCLANSVAEEMKSRAPGIIENSLRTNPKDLDPLATLMNSKTFDDVSRQHSMRCLQIHELGIGLQ